MASQGKGAEDRCRTGSAALAAWIPLTICLSAPGLTHAEIVAPVSQQNLPSLTSLARRSPL
jgi:hypothetical protein